MKKCAVFLLLLSASFLTGQSRTPARIPRMPDGKPRFSGVWAGPAFIHNVGPNDTDSPQVTNFDRAKMAPFLPGGEGKFYQRPTGDLRHDDPTELCLPDWPSARSACALCATDRPDSRRNRDPL